MTLPAVRPAQAFVYRPSDEDEPAKLYYKDHVALDVMLAGKDNCQPVQGLEVCLGDGDCTPSTQSVFYDCDTMVDVMLGVASVRAEELGDEFDAAGALASATSGRITGDDDASGGPRGYSSGDAPFGGDESRRCTRFSRGAARDSEETSRGAAGTARSGGDESGRRRDREIRRRRVGTPPGGWEETGRGAAAAATWIFRGDGAINT